MFGPYRSFKRVRRAKSSNPAAGPSGKNYISEHVATVENDIDAVYRDTTELANESGRPNRSRCRAQSGIVAKPSCRRGKDYRLGGYLPVHEFGCGTLETCQRHEECLLFGVDRNSSAQVQTDANDPLQTSRNERYSLQRSYAEDDCGRLSLRTSQRI